MDYINRNRLLTAKAETTPGSDATPAGSDAIATQNVDWQFDMGADLAPDENTSSLDAGAVTPLGGGVTLSGAVKVAGSGTPATAPEWGRLLQGAAMLETVTAAAITGTASAGGANTLTLASMTGVMVGMPINITGGAASGDWRTIVSIAGSVVTVDKDWSTATDNTSQYSIPANVLYTPASADLKTLSCYGYLNANRSGVDSRLHKLLGMVFNVSGQIGARQPPLLNFNGRGKLGAAPSEVSAVSPTFDGITAPPFIGVAATLGGVDLPLKSFGFDLGNELSQPDDPLQTYGVEAGDVTRRQIGVNLSLYADELATFTHLADFIGSVQKALALRWGSTAGNRFAWTVPTLQYAGPPRYAAIDNYVGEEIAGRAVGADSGLCLCCY